MNCPPICEESCLKISHSCSLEGKVSKKSASAPSTEKPGNEEKMDKPAQSTTKKEPVAKISMFTVPIKITPTKPAVKAPPRRIPLTPVQETQTLKTAVVGSANQGTLPIKPQVSSTTPITARQGMLPSVPGQITSGTKAASEVIPRRVLLTPAAESQARTLSNGITPTAKVPPGDVTPTLVNTATPIAGQAKSSTAARVQETTSQPPATSSKSPQHLETPTYPDSSGSSDKNAVSTSAATSSGISSEPPSCNAPRRISLTTLSTSVSKNNTYGSTQLKQSQGTNLKSDAKDGITSNNQERVAGDKEVPSVQMTEQHPPPKETTASMVKSSQARRVPLTTLPVKSPKSNSSQLPSATCPVGKENNTINQLGNNAQPQPRRVAFTTLTSPGADVKLDGPQNCARKSPTQSVPKRPIPLEPTVIILQD